MTAVSIAAPAAPPRRSTLVAIALRLLQVCLVANALAVAAVAVEAVIAPPSVAAVCDGWISVDSAGSAPQAGHDAQDHSSGSTTWSNGDIRIKLPSSFYCKGWATDASSYKYNGLGTQMVAADWSGKYYWMPMNPSGSTTNCTYAGTTNASNSGITDYMKQYAGACANATFPVGPNAAAFGVSQNVAYTNWGIGYASCTTFYSAQTVISQTSSATGPARPGANCGLPAWKGPDTFTSPKLDWSAPTATFSVPAAGTTFQSATSLSVTWSEADTGGSGVSTRSLQRQRGTVVTAGSCAGVSWTNDGTASTSVSPLSSTGLLSGYCYRWAQTLADVAGNSSTTTSGSVLVDTTAPAITWTTPSAAAYNTTGSITPSWSVSDPQSGVAGGGTVKRQYATLSSDACGASWTTEATQTNNTATTLTGGRCYRWTFDPALATGAAKPTNNAGLATTANLTSATVKVDTTASAITWNTPSAAAYNTSGSITPSWTVSDPQSGVAGSGTVTRQWASLSGDACGGTWTNEATQTNGSATTLTSGRCYRWNFTTAPSNNAGLTTSANLISPIVKVDTSGPAAPSVTCSGTGAYQAAANGVCYFRPAAASTLTMTSTGSDPQSDIASSTFGALSATTGWTYTSGTVNGNPAAKSATFASNAISTSLNISTTNKAGLASGNTNLSITVDSTAPSTSFSVPAVGGPAFTNNTSYTVTFAATDAAAGIGGTGGSGSWSLQRQIATATDGSCGAFSNDGSPVSQSTSGANLTSNQTLVGGNCYLWALSATDNVGNSASAVTSGTVLVDTVAPTGSFSAPALSTVVIGPVLATATANGANAWNNPGNALSDGEADFATTGSTKNTSYVLYLKSFPGLGDIPADATIGTVTVSYDWWASATTSSATLTASMTYGTGPSTICTNSAQPAATTHTTSTWSSCTPTRAQLADVDFAVSITADTGIYQGQAAATFSLAWVKVDVRYTTAGAPSSIVYATSSTVSFLTDDTGGSGVGSWQLQREKAAGTPTSCGAFGSDNSTPGTGGGAQTSAQSGLVAGNCYRWTLTATDRAGNSSAPVGSAAIYVSSLDAAGTGAEPYYTRVPFDLGGGFRLTVGVHNGEATLERDLFSIPSFGPPQALSLRYSSAETSSAGRFGVGWNSNLTQYLSFETGLIVWHRADGGREGFAQAGSLWTVIGGHYETLAAGSGADAGRYVITLRDQTKLLFDGTAPGRLARIENRFGKSLTLVWGASGATATDASGRATTLAIDPANDRITGVTDSAGRSWTFGYSGIDLASISDPAGHFTLFAYDAGHRLTSITRSRTAADGSAVTLVWSIGYTGGKATSLTDALGQTTSPLTSHTFTYGAGPTTVGLLKDTTNPAGPVRNTWTYTLDGSGRVTAATNPVGWTTNSTWDAMGNLLSQSHPIATGLAPVSTYAYDGSGNVLTQTDPVDATQNLTATMSYTATNDLLQRNQASNDSSVELVTRFTHDVAGHLTSVIVNCTSSGTTPPPGGAACTGAGTHDASTNLTTSYTWTANDQLATETDPLGHVTLHSYDAFGNETGVTRNYVAGQSSTADRNVTTSRAYDQATTAGKAGLPTSMTDPLGLTTTYTHDILGRLTSQTDPGDELWIEPSIPTRRTVHTYDELGNEIRTEEFWPATDTTAQRTTTVVFDRLNRSTSTDRDGVVSTTAYDAAGNPVSETANGVTTTRTFDGLGRATSETAGGTTTSHTFDGQGREISSSISGAGTTTRTFDYVGNLLSETADAGGANLTTTHTYDLLGRRKMATEPGGLTTTFTIHRTGRVTREVVSGGAISTTTDTTYDTNGNILTTTAPYASGQTPVVTRTIYDGLDRPTAVTANYVAGSSDPNANLTTTTYYDAAGNAVAGVDPKGTVNRTFYNARGLAAETIANCTDVGKSPPADPAACAGTGDADGTFNVTLTMTYDGGAALTSMTSGSTVVPSFPGGPSTPSGAVTTTRTYDAAGRLVEFVVDAGSGHLNLTTRYGYDSAGRQTAVMDPRGTITRTVYDLAGRVSQTIVNCTNTGTTIPTTGWESCAGTGTHDATWNVTTSYTYDQAGNRVSETAPNGRVTTYVYDNAGRMVSRTEDDVATPTQADEDLTTFFYYDAAGRQAAVKAPTADRDTFTVTRYLYEDLGRLGTEIQNCTNSDTTPPPDPATCTGNGTRDAATNLVTSYTYDARGNRLSMTAPNPADGSAGTSTVTTRYAYDANDRLCRVLENATVDLQTLPDPCSTAVAGTATGNVSTRYTYEAAGNLAMMIDANGHTTSYVTDAVGRLVGITDADGTTLSWTYDGRGNRVGQTNRDATAITWTYDGADRMIERTANGVTTSYTYDPTGNRLTSAGPAGTITATYDRLARPLTVTAEDGTATSYSYDFTNPSWTDPTGTYLAILDAFGREVSLRDPIHGATAWTTSYRADGQPASRVDPTANSTNFAYDPVGRLTAKTTTGAGGTPLRAAYAYTYNRAGHRVDETSTIATDPTNGTVAYTYDPLGRLTGYAPTGSPAETYGWQAVPNRGTVQVGANPAVITTFDPANRPTADSGGGSYAHDADGRLTARPGQTLEWDSLGRLTRVLAAPGGAVLATYGYDALDRLRIVDHGASDRTRFRYVGLTTSVAQIVDDATGSAISNVGTSWSGELLMDWNGGGVSQRLYGTNAHHDLTWIAGPDGTVAGTLRYDPWGVVVSSTGASLPDFRFQGSWHDSSTALAWVVTRWYAAAIGRFISEDSLLGEPTRPASRHLYAYAQGEPVGRWDVDGRYCTGCTPAWMSTATPARPKSKVFYFNRLPNTAGRLELSLFIRARRVLVGSFPWDAYVAHNLYTHGDDRSWSGTSTNCIWARGCIFVNLSYGYAWVRVNPTCTDDVFISFFSSTTLTNCHDAFKVDTFANCSATQECNKVRVWIDSLGRLRLKWSITQSALPIVRPDLTVDGWLSVKRADLYAPNGRIRYFGDGFPSEELYYRDPEGVRHTIFRHLGENWWDMKTDWADWYYPSSGTAALPFAHTNK